MENLQKNELLVEIREKKTNFLNIYERNNFDKIRTFHAKTDKLKFYYL